MNVHQAEERQGSKTHESDEPPMSFESVRIKFGKEECK